MSAWGERLCSCRELRESCTRSRAERAPILPDNRVARVPAILVTISHSVRTAPHRMRRPSRTRCWPRGYAFRNGGEIPLLLALAEGLTSRSRHSLLLQESPPSGKLLIPLERRDVRVVEGARLESESGDAHLATPKQLFAQSIKNFPPPNASRCEPVNVAVCQRFRGDLTQFLHSSQRHLGAYAVMLFGTL